jgi:hypothetical protein
MPKHRKKEVARNQKVAEPRSLIIAQSGIETGSDFAKCMSFLMADLIEGRVSPAIGNAMCSAGGKLLKVVEMQLRYGSPGAVGAPHGHKVLNLTKPPETP